MKPRQIIFVDSMFALARAAQQGAGIALLPMPVSKSWFESGALVPLHDSSLVVDDFYWMSLNRHPGKDQAAEVFWDWMLYNMQQESSYMGELNSSVA